MFPSHVMPFQRHFVEDVGHVDDVLHDYRICHQVHIFYPFFLFNRVTLPDYPITTKTEPGDKAIVSFYFCRRGLDLGPKRRI